MKPAPFRYFAPTRLEGVLDLLEEHGADAKLLAGGQSLVPAMNFRLSQPAILIDLNGVSELEGIEPSDSGGLTIGAMTRQRTVERSALVRDEVPLLAEALPFIAHPQIRNRGTMGGSVAHADPAAELPAVMLALDAQFELRSRRGSRRVAAADFFTGLFATALGFDEVLAAIHMPARVDGYGWAFDEMSRRHGDYALVGVASAVRLDQTGRCRDAKLSLLSVGSGPVSADRAAELLVGEQPTPDLWKAVAEAALSACEPPDDIHASAEFRRHLVRMLVARTLKRACGRARLREG